MANKKRILQYQVKADTSQSIKSIGQLEEEIEKLNEQIKDVDNRDEFNQLASQIANASSELKTLELQFEGLDTEQRASEFGSFASGLADTATGAIALSQAMGLTNSEMGESVETLVQGFAVANAFRSGIEGIISAQKLLRASTIAQTVATNGGTVATRILNAVMSANPVFLLITGITALVGAFALFGSASADAAKEAAKLNAQLELVNQALERQNDILDDNLADFEKRLDNQNKILDGEIKYLQAIKNRTKEQEALLKKKLGEREANEIKAIDAAIENADTKTKQFAESFELQFKLIDNAIKQTDIEDGVNDINYDKVKSEVKDFKKELDAVLNSDLGTEEKVAALQDLEGQFQKTSSKLSDYNLNLGEAEQEKFEDVISGFGSIGDLISKNVDTLREYNGLVQDKGNVTAIKDQEKAYEDLQKRQEAREKAREKAEEVRKARQEAEKKRLEDLQKLEDDYWLRQQSQEEQAVIRRQQQLDEELAIAEGNAELQAQLVEEAERNITKIRADFAAERSAKAKEELESQYAREDEQFRLLQELQNTEQENEVADLVAFYEEKFALAVGNAELEKALEDKLKSDLKEINDRYRKEEEAAEKEAQQKKVLGRQELGEKYVSLTLGAFGAINDIIQASAGESEAAQRKAFNTQKAFNLASAIANTGLAVTAALTAGGNPIKLATGTQFIEAGIAAATGAAQVINIAKTKFKGGGSAASASSGASIRPPQAATLNNSTLFGTGGNPEELISSTNQSQQSTPVVKAVVVESDITTTQNNVKTVKETATI